MSDTEELVARAKADLHRAEAAAERAREGLKKAEAEVADLEAFLRMMDRYAHTDASRGAATSPGVTVRTTHQGGSRAKELVDAAIDAIRTTGQPMPIGDLLDAVIAQGFKFGGQDHKSNLAGYLSRDPRVVSRGRGIGWDIADEGQAADDMTPHAAEPDDGLDQPNSPRDKFDELLG